MLSTLETKQANLSLIRTLGSQRLKSKRNSPGSLRVCKGDLGVTTRRLFSFEEWGHCQTKGNMRMKLPVMLVTKGSGAHGSNKEVGIEEAGLIASLPTHMNSASYRGLRKALLDLPLSQLKHHRWL